MPNRLFLSLSCVIGYLFFPAQQILADPTPCFVSTGGVPEPLPPEGCYHEDILVAPTWECYDIIDTDPNNTEACYNYWWPRNSYKYKGWYRGTCPKTFPVNTLGITSSAHCIWQELKSHDNVCSNGIPPLNKGSLLTSRWLQPKGCPGTDGQGQVCWGHGTCNASLQCNCKLHLTRQGNHLNAACYRRSWVGPSKWC